MKHLTNFLCFLLVCAMSVGSNVAHAQPGKLRVLSIWQPVDAPTLKALVKRYRNDALVLEALTQRALIYNQVRPMLDAMRDELDANDKNKTRNDTMRASYAMALFILRGSHRKEKAPASFGSRHAFGSKQIGEFIDESKQGLNVPWMAFVADADYTLTRGGIYTEKTERAKRALQANRNPMTLTFYAETLMDKQAANEGDVKDSQEAIRILTNVKRVSPWYWRSNRDLWQFYAYYPATRDDAKAAKAYRELVATIPQSLRNTAAIQRYLKWQHWDQRRDMSYP